MRSAIKKIFWLYALIFLILIGYLLKLCLYDSHSFVANPFNPRLSQSYEGIKRGSIYDSNGDVIAEDVKQDDGTFKRVYKNARYYAHVVGYTVKGKAGVESKYNFRLESINNEFLQRVGNLFLGKDIEGNSLVLTIDNRLQEIAGEELGNQRGSIVAMEPSTGKILAMVSNPAFDSNTVAENWEELNSDDKNSPLLNRATQGLYPPGSTFKIITAAAALEADKALESFEIDCDGEEKFGHSIIHCYNGKAHGNVNMDSAFAKSCNIYFSEIGVKIGAGKLIDMAYAFGFNKDIGLSLEYSKSTFPMTLEAEENEIVETSFGQGRTLVTPLFMAMVTSAVANNGMMMQPYVVDHSLTPSGGVRNRTLPVKLNQAISPGLASQIKELMCGVVENNGGTAQNASFSVSGTAVNYDENESGASVSKGAYSGKIRVAGKTGTAENPQGDDHAWFVAFAPADEPKIAVAVLLENAGKGSNAIPAAREIMKTYIENLAG
ncbi:MAG: penicillin-binding transpeptidase domain-containing protein [Clostridia bacterium]|nr:penicillin-binding transpeptidase domain-containing protein [Clostridia bacterium]